MTCAACANRIERTLNKLDGLNAEVNFALERAEVRSSEHALHLEDDDVERAIAAVEKAGYHARRAPEAADRREAVTHQEAVRADAARALARRLWTCLALAAPVVILSMVPAAQFPGWQWLALALTLPVATWGAWPFHRASWLGIRHGGIRGMSMNTLISLGITAALAWSLWSLVFGHAGMIGMRHEMSLDLDRDRAAGHLYLEVAASVTVFMLAGRLAEARAKRAAGQALRALLTLGADRAERIRGDGSSEEIAAEQLAVGDLFRVRPGTRIPADGVVEEGTSAIDASMVTGESVPVDVGPGSAVTGATVNTSGSLIVRATHVGSDTMLARMARMVDEAQSGKAAAQRIADKIAGVFVPVVIALAIVTLLMWLIIGAEPERAFGAAVAVLIIACPCALGLATPMAILVGSGRGARLGILIRGPEALEHARAIRRIVLDKTGTLTSGEMRLESVTLLRRHRGAVAPAAMRDAVVVEAAGSTGAQCDASETTEMSMHITDGDHALALAAGVERESEHPIARALTSAALSRGLTLTRPNGFTNTPGEGVVAHLDGVEVRVGRVRGEDAAAAADEADTRGLTSVALAVDGVEQAVFHLGDDIRPSTRAALAELRVLGIEPILASGDGEAPVRAVASALGIRDARSGIRPEEKLALIRELGEGTAMLGDGVNDAPALASAQLGIAMGGGTDAAMEAADMTLIRDDLALVPQAIRLARATRRTIIGNLVWAFGYNVAAIPLAALGYLSPTIAGAAMACSSLFVILNSLRLNLFR